MIEEPNAEADAEHDRVRKQRLPMSIEAQKLAMFDELVMALDAATMFELSAESFNSMRDLVNRARDLQ